LLHCVAASILSPMPEQDADLGPLRILRYPFWTGRTEIYHTRALTTTIMSAQVGQAACRATRGCALFEANGEKKYMRGSCS
jgi:hypothetical protein